MDSPQVHCLFDEMTAVENLKPHPQNRNTHPDEQIARLAQILEFQGWRYPIKVSKRSGFITSGHGRLLAAKLKGWPAVPVNFQDYDSADQEYADVQADNAIASWAELDLSGIHKDLEQLGPFDIDLLGIKDFEFEPVEQVPGCDEDEVPEAPAEPKTKRGDIYQLGRHRLMCGSSTSFDDVGKLTDGQSADFSFTSPPYGVGLDYGTYQDTFENCCNLLREVAPVIFHVLRPGGVLVTNFGDIISAREINKTEAPSEYPMALQYWPAFTGAGFTLHTRRIWAKPHARVAAPWCASSNRAASDWEHLWTWIKPGPFINERRTPSYLGVWDTSKMEGVGDHGKDVHPAGFPVSIASIGIEVYTNSGETLFEPFGGTGTMLVACEKTNRRCFMMELDPKYCDVIVSRWEKFTGQKAELISG